MKELVYGADTGRCDRQKIIEMDDWELFFEYRSTALAICDLTHGSYGSLSDDNISERDFVFIAMELEEMQYSIEYLLYAISKRNGIKVNEPAPGTHINPDKDEFNRWYGYYENHFYKKMSDSKRRTFIKKHKKGSNISKYLPKGNWRDYNPK